MKKEQWNKLNQRMENAKMRFKNHFPKFQKFGDIAVLDWRNKDGTYKDAVRYVFDGDRVYISGSLGTAVVHWHEKADLHKIACWTLNYFVRKIECSTILYDFDDGRAENEIYDIIDECLDEDERGDYMEGLIQNFTIELLAYATEDGIQFITEEASRLRELIVPYLKDNDFVNVGKMVADEVILWYVGIDMAYEMLVRGKGKEILRE